VLVDRDLYCPPRTGKPQDGAAEGEGEGEGEGEAAAVEGVSDSTARMPRTSHQSDDLDPNSPHTSIILDPSHPDRHTFPAFAVMARIQADTMDTITAEGMVEANLTIAQVMERRISTNRTAHIVRNRAGHEEARMEVTVDLAIVDEDVRSVVI
jgi:hypothetical protein